MSKLLGPTYPAVLFLLKYSYLLRGFVLSGSNWRKNCDKLS